VEKSVKEIVLCGKKCERNREREREREREERVREFVV